MAAGDFYQIDLESTAISQKMHSIFWYRQALGTLGAQNLLSGFVEDVFPAIRAIASAASAYVKITVKAHDDPTDFAEFAFTATPGLRAGARLPLFVAAGFQCPRGRTDMRRGRKRFSAIVEEDITGDNWIAAFITLGATLSTALGAEVQYAVQPGNTYRPVIVRRVKYITPEGKEAYKVPDIINSGDFYDAVNWTLDLAPTTQNTRKVGRGE